jgi:hypothetical protein
MILAIWLPASSPVCCPVLVSPLLMILLSAGFCRFCHHQARQNFDYPAMHLGGPRLASLGTRVQASRWRDNHLRSLDGWIIMPTSNASRAIPAPIAATPPSNCPLRKNSAAGTASEIPALMTAAPPRTCQLSRKRAIATPISETPTAISQAPNSGMRAVRSPPIPAPINATRILASATVCHHGNHYPALLSQFSRRTRAGPCAEPLI